MATSFITMNDVNGFWIDDGLMQVVCWGIVCTIDNDYLTNGEWMKDNFREHIFNNSQGIFVGFMHLKLDDFLTSDYRISSFVECIERTKKMFLRFGDLIPVEWLNNFQLIDSTRREWVSPLQTKVVIKVLNSLELVVKGEFELKDIDTTGYEFFDE